MELDSITQGSTHVVANNPRRALEELIREPCNNKIATYSVEREFILNNIGVLEVANGEAFFDAQIRDGDMVGNFQSNARMELVLNGSLHSSNNRVVLVSCMYTETKIRLFVNPNNLPDKVTLSYDVTLLSPDLRVRVREPLLLWCDGLKYSGGVASAR